MVSNFSGYQNHLEYLLRDRLLGLIIEMSPRIYDSVDVEWDPRISISNKFSGDVDGFSPYFENKSLE